MILKSVLQKWSGWIRVGLLSITILTCAIISQKVPADGPDFLISPYIFSIKGQQLALSWQYVDTSSFNNKISNILFFKGAPAKELSPMLRNGLYTAILPIPVCGFGSEISYLVPGMKQRQTIANIPCRGQGATRFTFIADTQGSAMYDNIFAKDILAFNGSAVIAGGDLTDAGSSMPLWLSFFQAMSPAISQQAIIPVVGNHEYRKDDKVPNWYNFFGVKAEDAHYSLDLGDAHIIVLNSCFEDDPSQLARQLTWLENELRKPAPWKVVTFHHSPYSRSIMNNPIYVRKEFKIVQRNFIPLFEKYKVDVVLSGHVHFYEHSFRNGIHYIVTGPAGGILGVVGSYNPHFVTYQRDRTFIRMDVTDRQFHAQAVNINNNVIDDLVLKK